MRLTLFLGYHERLIVGEISQVGNRANDTVMRQAVEGDVFPKGAGNLGFDGFDNLAIEGARFPDFGILGNRSLDR